MSTTQTQTINKPPVWETQCAMNYADVPVLDFSQWDDPEGKAKLVAQVKDTVAKTGFFYVTNFGVSEDEIKEQWDIGSRVLDLPTDEKMRFKAPLEVGDYNGYRPLGSIEQFPGLRDNWECYHIFKFLEQYQKPHPQIIKDNYATIEKFHRHVHEDVAYKVLRLLALVLEMPEDFFVDKHKYDEPSSAFLRYMKYHPRAPEINEQYKQVYTRGHTDFGSVTFLFSQPVGGLELQTREGDWKAVKHIPGSIIVNTADMMHFWTKGFLNSCMHRVNAPPKDQEHMERFGLIYFLRPSDSAVLKMIDSPVLKRTGFSEKTESAELEAKRHVTVGEWIPLQTKKNFTPFNEQPQGQREFQSLFR